MTEQPGFQLAGSAPERYERFLPPIMGPFVAALLEATSVGPDDAVLDLACGTGFAARSAAALVGASGRVAGVDINPGMLATARAASAEVVPAIEWHEAPADRLPFGDAEFDAAVCQQGLQFFPDLRSAVAEAARVTREGGRVAATVWSPLERSPYFAAQLGAVEEIVGPETTASFAAAFACSEEQVASAFRAAGLRDVEGREVVVEIRLPPLAGFVGGHLAAVPWGTAVAAARPDGLDLAAASIVERLDPDTDADGSLTSPFASLLVAGTR